VEAELALADRELPGAESVSSAGDPLAVVLLLKGEPGPAETGGGIAFSGPDGDAARKALDALGHDSDRVFFALTRPLPDPDPEAVASRVRRIVEAIDPEWVVCADPVAGDDVGRAFDARGPLDAKETTLAGRRLLVLSGLEASLADEGLKRTVWAELKAMELTDGRKP
jgi:hypothetical protein